MTTQAQIDLARQVAKDIEALSEIREARVDDWDDWGGFNLFVYPKGDCRSGMIYFDVPLQGILARIKSRIKHDGAFFEWAESPKREYARFSSEKKGYFNGYDRNNYKISIRVP